MQRMFTPPWSDPASVRVIFFAVYSFPLDVDLYGVLMVAGCSFGTELSAVRAPLYMHIAGFILFSEALLHSSFRNITVKYVFHSYNTV
ncbi:hypothetical protein F9C07_1378662 [Aspergillus flavus]|uniref:Uncharacterized protein n=1 Tax=Aspergillus flavus (strain ATCC 200026 / FGSC A1120 / IAM 13836 / NRRL 3357 / JCM 12722 / SRRC 167) TaxID=332952 RepID=A0A7U2MKP8_ASPFN|nr:hypothetical protein F9C07_1378662 [Aspergillus flavus]